jgi:hypothetical protein
MTVADVPDAILNSPSYIPLAERWIEKRLGRAVTALDSVDQIFAQAAMIAFVAKKIIASPPLDAIAGGPVELTPATSDNKVKIIQELDKEITENLRDCGVSQSFMSVSTSGGYDGCTSTLY